MHNATHARPANAKSSMSNVAESENFACILM